MLKTLSLQTLKDRISNTWSRFPIPITLAFIASLISISLIWDKPTEPSLTTALQIIYTAVISFFLTTAVTLLCEKKKCSKKECLLSVFVTVIAVAVIVDFIIGDNISQFIPHTLLSVASFILVFVSPFLIKGDEDETWNFGFALSRRFLLGILFGIVAFLGTGIALAAIDNLLQIKVDTNIYPSLYVAISMFFSPLYVLAGLPDVQKEGWQKDLQYPTFLRILTQYILIPLVAIYMVILYIYCGRTIFTWDWPSGKMIYYAIAFFIPALLSVIFLTPMKNKPEFAWVKKVEKIFFYAALPLLFPYFYAILVRIMGNDAITNHFDSFRRSGFSMTGGNGLTWQRFYVVLFGIWFMGVAIYRLFAKKVNFKYLIISGCLLIAITAVGPLSAFNLSTWNQMTRLRYILDKNNYLINGHMVFPQSNIDYKTGNEIYSIINYIVTFGNIDDLKAMMTPDQRKEYDKRKKDGKVWTYQIQEVLGLHYDLSDTTGKANKTKYTQYLTGNKQQFALIPNAQYYQPFYIYTAGHYNSPVDTAINGDQLHVEISNQKNGQMILSAQIVNKGIFLSVDMLEYVKKISPDYPSSHSSSLSPKDRIIIVKKDGYTLSIVLDNLTFSVNNGTVEKVDDVGGTIFVGKD